MQYVSDSLSSIRPPGRPGFKPGASGAARNSEASLSSPRQARPRTGYKTKNSERGLDAKSGDTANYYNQRLISEY